MTEYKPISQPLYELAQWRNYLLTIKEMSRVAQPLDIDILIEQIDQKIEEYRPK